MQHRRTSHVHHPEARRSAVGRPRRRGLVPTLVVGSIGVLVAGSATALPQDDGVAEARALLQQWFETQRAIAEERTDWELTRALLTDQIAVLETEVAEERAAIDEKVAETERDQAELDELIKTRTDLEQTTANLEARIEVVEQRVRAIAERLPRPLKERIAPLVQQIPTPEELSAAKAAETAPAGAPAATNDAASEAGEAGDGAGAADAASGDDATVTPEPPAVKPVPSVSIRYRNVLGILNGIDRFNTEIIVENEVRDLPQGGSAEVTAVYVGIGQAYYAGANGTVAGIGRATADGWDWEPRNEAAEAIMKAIAILRAEDVASFVPLPVEID